LGSWCESFPPHITIALLGLFNGETRENYHLLPIVSLTRLGIDNKIWIGRLLGIYETKNILSGPLFRTSLGQRIKAGDFDQTFFDRLEQVQTTRPDFIPSSEDTEEEFDIYRSFRRGSTSEATNQGLPPDVIDANNRWRRFNQSGAGCPSLSMREHYTDVRLTFNKSLRYSACF
jgi:hypothetical protein